MKETRKRGFSIKPEALALIGKKMAEKGYNSREQLAEAANYLSIDTVNRLLRGDNTQRKTIEAIAKALDLKPTDLVDPSEWYPASSTAAQEKTAASEIDIDWREVCRAMLEKQQESQRLRRKATEMGFEVNVHVPLGLVERKQQQRRSGNVELAQVYQLAQEVVAKTYQHDEFLTEVIGQRQTRKNKNIAIVGEPGAGKTTLLGAIASFIQSNTEDLPICITLASLQGRTIEDYLLKTWLSEAMGLVNPKLVITPETENELIKQFRQGGVWLMLDAVDEMGADSPVQALATIQKQLTDWIGQARVVLTCRVNVWDVSVNNILIGFDTYRTQEFTHEEIHQFIQDWFACAEDAQRGEQLQAKLKEPGRKRILELVKHPLRLALLCQIFYLDKSGDLPETKAALYERFTRYFYEWKQSLHPKNFVNQDELHQALGKLALAGINSKIRFRLKQSLVHQEIGERLFKLADALGWLNLVDRDIETDEPVYAFFHPTFQEYFAALAIDDWNYFLPRNHDNNNPMPVAETYRIFEPQWKEVILLWLGRENVQKQHKEDYIKALVEFQDGLNHPFYRVRAYCLAAIGIAEFRTCILADAIITNIVKGVFGYFDDKKQKWVKFPNWLIRESRKVLKETDQTKVILALVQLIQNTQDERRLWMLSDKLVDIDPSNEIANKILVNLIHTTQNKFTRCLAVESWEKANNIRQQSEINQQRFFRGKVNEDFELILPDDILLEELLFIKNFFTQGIKKNDSDKKVFNDMLWECARSMAYSYFYRAWYGEPSPVQTLENQFTDIASQLQPTDKTYPLAINAQALEGETDTSAIAQALSNRIYRFVFPDDSEIPPEVSNAYQLERLIPQLKKQLQKLNLAVILDKCEPNQAQITFCRKLTDVLHIAWITNQPLEAPLKGFPREQANLLSAVQSWIDEIG
jgi:signal recognition particle GTPase